MYQRYLLPFPNVSKTEEKINHFDSYEKELKVLNQADLVLGYSWTSHNSHQRMDYQKSDWEGRGVGGRYGRGGEEIHGCFRFFLFVWMVFFLYYLIEIFSCVCFCCFS